MLSNPYNPTTPSEIEKGWFIYVNPDRFTRQDYRSIVNIYEHNKSIIDSTVRAISRAIRLEKIGIIAYAKEYNYDIFSKGGFKISVFPNGRWFRGIPDGTHGGPSGRAYPKDEDIVFKVPRIHKHHFRSYFGIGIPYNPYIIGECKNKEGKRIKDIFTIGK